MARADAPTVASYLASLPVDRRKVVRTVRTALRKAMPAGYEEAMAGTMITWAVPKRVLPDTYNGQALWYVALTAQKNYFALYLMGAYGSPVLRAELKAGYENAGIRLDMGKACVRFKALPDVPLDVIGRIVSRVSMDEYVRLYRASRRR
jgi:hypothetical protein